MVLPVQFVRFEVIQLNSCLAQKGDWGNILFVHDNVFAYLALIIYDMAAGAQCGGRSNT